MCYHMRMLVWPVNSIVCQCALQCIGATVWNAPKLLFSFPVRETKDKVNGCCKLFDSRKGVCGVSRLCLNSSTTETGKLLRVLIW